MKLYIYSTYLKKEEKMKFKVKDKIKIIVIEVYDKFIGGPGISGFQDTIVEALNNRKKRIIIDLSGVKYINSIAIGVLIRALTTARNAGGDLVLAALPYKVKGVLSITRLDSVFKIFDNVEEAVKSCNESLKD